MRQETRTSELLGAPLGAQWETLGEEVFAGMRTWRQAHPKATLTAIETALDERWARARAQILQDVALSSAAAQVSGQAGAERAVCPQCATPLEARGTAQRTLTTTYEQPLHLTRTYAVCPACGAGHFPPG
jgi:RNase P subunit RPR2